MVLAEWCGPHTQLVAGTEVDPWQSVAGRNTQLAAGAVAWSWQSVAARTTQLAAGAEVVPRSEEPAPDPQP
ncbi:hypothetical protein, partial [Pseudomonas aeruginosa]|uniref:hypothetical protein n=1 Tax=Pseudomonas aeruginosa TaxID=287 RepID=UPI001C533511